MESRGISEFFSKRSTILVNKDNDVYIYITRKTDYKSVYVQVHVIQMNCLPNIIKTY